MLVCCSIFYTIGVLYDAFIDVSLLLLIPLLPLLGNPAKRVRDLRTEDVEFIADNADKAADVRTSSHRNINTRCYIQTNTFIFGSIHTIHYT